jgi:hypothetical protein
VRFERVSPALVVACIALVVALGGTGWAASRSPVAKRADGKGSARTAQGPRGKRGPAGSAGAAGAAGMAGAEGQPGAPGSNGKDGAEGKAGADGVDGEDGVVAGYMTTVHNTENPAGFFGRPITAAWPAATTVRSLELPAGTYFVTGTDQLYLHDNEAIVEGVRELDKAEVYCWLEGAGKREDFTQIATPTVNSSAPGPVFSYQGLALQGPFELPAPGTVSIECSRTIESAAQAYFERAVLSAVAVGSETLTAEP